MQLRQLQFVVTLSQTKTVTEAAKRQSVSVATLSSQVLRLESELGVRLFKQQELAVELTAAGVLFVKKARSILNECELLTGGCRRSANSIPSAKQAAREQCKTDSLESTVPVLATVRNGIVSDPRFVLVAGEQHPLARRDSVSLALLEHEPLVSFSNCARLSEAKTLLRTRGIRPRVVYETEDYDRAIDLIRAQAGIAIFPPLNPCAGVVQIPFSDIELSDVHKLQ